MTDSKYTMSEAEWSEYLKKSSSITVPVPQIEEIRKQLVKFVNKK